MRKIILLNLYAFLFWIIASIISFFDLSFLRYLESFSNLIITLVLVGINLTALIQIFRTKLFSKIEILSIASVLSLLVAPLLVTSEFTFFGLLFAKLPFLNSLAIFILLLIVNYKKKRDDLENFDFFSLNAEKDAVLKFMKSPIATAFFIYTVSIFIIFSAFFALPELDPYYWYLNFQDLLTNGMLASLSSYRPSFMSFIYILNQSSEIDLYAIFKYVLPFLMILVIMPAWLVAQNQNSRIKKFSILLAPFISASIFLYSQLPIPQAILNITLFYFTFFLLHSWITKDDFFYFFSGIIILLAYFFHESAILVFLIWSAIVLLVYRKNIINFIKNNRLSSFLIFVIFILNFSQLLKWPYLFLTYQSDYIFSNMHGFNFLFPAKYSNVDGNLMGWNSLTGVIKYYIYYVGPVFFITIAYFFYLFFRNQQFKKYAKKNLASKELLTLLIAFLCFFSISEIFPRLSNIALLPERAWLFGGIFSLVFLFIIFIYQNYIKLLYLFIIFSLSINLGGAFYINSLKKYVITPNNLYSTEWIKQNLPESRIIFSNNNAGALELYSQSKVVSVPDEFYHSIDVYKNNIDQFKYGKIELGAEYNILSNELIAGTSSLKNYNIENQKSEISNIIKKNSSISNKILTLTSLPDNNDAKDLYIYFSEIDKNNPYIDRPYYQDFNLSKDFIFDKYHDKFKRVYEEKQSNIIIWKIL